MKHYNTFIFDIKTFFEASGHTVNDLEYDELFFGCIMMRTERLAWCGDLRYLGDNDDGEEMFEDIER